jgi:hypothetical protein
MYLMFRILFLSFFQNIAFSIVSRSRNRNNLTYHLIAATLSNTIWFLTFRALVTSNMDFVLFVPYTLGTVAGSLYGVSISMKIETWLGAASDSHIKPVSPIVAGPFITMAELKQVLALEFEIFYKQRIMRLESRIVGVYSRTLRKLRSEMQWVRDTLAAKVQSNVAVFQASPAFLERQRIHSLLEPQIPKSTTGHKRRGNSNWSNFTRAGQLHLGW